MAGARTFVGIDLGASSGRAVLGTLADGVLSLEEISRFANAPVLRHGILCWDFPYLWQSILDALRAAARRAPEGLAGIGVDSWAIDFGLLGADGALMGNPACYRDGRTEGMEELLRRVMGDEEIYRRTGVTPARFATLPQLLAAGRTLPGGLATAHSMLFIPDLVRYFLCGARSTERTIIGTSLLSDVRTGGWCGPILDAFGIPRALLPPVVDIGTVAGTLLPSVREATGLSAVPVMVTAGHDTLAAAAAVPSAGPADLFVSCGTWAVLGLVRDAPVTTPEAMAAGLVNELGAGCIVIARNLQGFWILERLRDEWRREGRATGWDALVAGAAAAAPLRLFIDPEDPGFFSSGSMRAAVRAFLRASGQEEEHGSAALARACYEGLAFSFRRAIGEIESVTGEPVGTVSVVGGGSRNGLFCRMIADATGREVRAGPAEATIVGTIGLQAVAAGALAGVSQLREMAARSFPRAIYRPADTVPWDRAFERFEEASRRARARSPAGAGAS